MKKELSYFEIDGAFGGNQDWFTNIVMHIGGCAAATACDCCIYFAREKNLTALYPYDVHNLTQNDYKRFSQIMKPYIPPRVHGVKKLEWFIEGFLSYIHTVEQNTALKIPVAMKPFPGTHTLKEAKALIIRQIDKGYPVPCLLLHHKDTEQFRDYIWHWFLLVGYEESGADLRIKAATYGEAVTFSLRELWDTGYEERGGLIEFCPTSC